jgi:Secretion system C-terminal sorting domain
MGVPQGTTPASSVSLDYRVYWPGNVTCYLDYIVVDDNTASSLFAGGYDYQINTEVNSFKTNSGLGRFKIRDEVDPGVYGQYLSVGRVDQTIKSNVNASGYPTKTGYHYNVGYWQGLQYIGRDIAWTQSNQSASDIYPISHTLPLPDDPSYTTTFQNQIQTNLVTYLTANITYANHYTVPFWFCPQAHSWTGALREPTVTELRQMVNLGLTYGAKGIEYFLYMSYAPGGVITSEGLAEPDGSPRHIIYAGTSYAGDKWATVKSINQQLSLLGPTLIGLTWQSAFSIHTLSGASTGTYVSSVTTGVDAANQTYIELGLFADASSNKYFMLVNRRTHSNETRNVTTTFSLPSGYYEITEQVSGKIWIIPNNGSFTDALDPGAGKLYKIGSVTYQAYLLALAAQGNSLSSSATAGNNQRKMYRDSGGRIHEVFESGGEVFYRNSTSGGSTWEVVRGLSAGSGNNSAPCIAMSGTNLAVVWQQNLSSAYNVAVVRSTDGGNSWSVPSFADSNFAASTSPSPSVSGSSTGLAHLTYRYTSYLKALKSTNSGSTWTSITGPSGTSASYNPSSGFNEYSTYQTFYKANVAYQGTSAGGNPNVLFNAYDIGSSSWTGVVDLTTVIPSQYSQHSSPSLGSSENTQMVHVVWDALYSLGGGRVIVHRNGLLGSFGSTYSVLHYQSENKPQISCASGGAAWMVYQNTNGNGIWKRHYNGTSWDGYYGTYISTGHDPQISTGLTSMRYGWTDGKASPYTLQFASETLSKEGGLPEFTYSRELNLIDTTTGSNVSVQFGDIKVRHSGGVCENIDFGVSPSDTTKLTLPALLDAGQTKTFVISGDADTLEFIAKIVGNSPRSFFTSSNGGVRFTLMNQQMSMAFGTFGATFVSGIRAGNALQRFQIPLKGLNAGKDGVTAIIKPEFIGLNGNAGQLVSLGHIYSVFDQESLAKMGATVEELSTPAAVQVYYDLSQNYPNPFNPSTTIRFGLPTAGNVSLIVYDVLGREVTTLVKGTLDAGYHTATWNASSVASGVYFARLTVTNEFGKVAFNKVTKLLLMK